MNAVIKFVKDPLVLTIIAVILVPLFAALYVKGGDGKLRDKWMDACFEEGGKPYLDQHTRGIGRSICLRPNSIILVPVYE